MDIIRDLLAGIGGLTVVWLAASCLGSYMDAKMPDSVPKPRFDPRDKRAEWDRIQGR